MRTVLLSCGDNKSTLASIEKGDEIYCLKCNQSTVALAISDTYTARCNDCNFKRNYDTQQNAERGMTLHLRSNVGHLITLYLGNKVVTVRKVEQIQLPLYHEAFNI